MYGEYLTVLQISKIFNIKLLEIYNLINLGVIQVLKINNLIRVPRFEVERYFNQTSNIILI